MIWCDMIWCDMMCYDVMRSRVELNVRIHTLIVFDRSGKCLQSVALRLILRYTFIFNSSFISFFSKSVALFFTSHFSCSDSYFFLFYFLFMQFVQRVIFTQCYDANQFFPPLSSPLLLSCLLPSLLSSPFLFSLLPSFPFLSSPFLLSLSHRVRKNNCFMFYTISDIKNWRFLIDLF